MGALGMVSDTLQVLKFFRLDKRIAYLPGTAHDLLVLPRRFGVGDDLEDDMVGIAAAAIER